MAEPILTPADINRLTQYLYEEGVLSVRAMTDKPLIVKGVTNALERLGEPEPQPNRLLCVVCVRPIGPEELRFKAWTTDSNGNTESREYVHLYHAVTGEES